MKTTHSNADESDPRISPDDLDATSVRRWKRTEVIQPLDLPWELKLPGHWKSRKLKFIASVRPSNVDKKTVDGEKSVRLCNYVDVYKNEFITEELEFMQASASESQVESFRIRAGDVVITKDSEAWDDIAVPAYVPEEIEDLVCGYHLALIRPDRAVCDGRYLHRCFEAEGLCDQFRIAANGITRYGLGTYSLRNALFPVPPLEEQRAIAAFLDRETTRIDTLIAKKEQLITLLEEKRQALINQFITSGLDCNSRMKCSGVAWLGEVPHHWRQTRLKFLVESRDGIQMGPFGGMLKELEERPTGYKLYGQENTINDDFEAGGRWLTKEQYVSLRHYELRPGDIVLTRKGASIGNCRIVPEGILPGVIDSDTIRVRLCEEKLTTDYAVLLMHEGYLQTEILAMQKGAVLPGLNTSMIASLRIALPPSDEQNEILRALRTTCGMMDKLIAQVRFGVDRVQEYRTSLISAAVIGQIDVRQEVPS